MTTGTKRRACEGKTRHATRKSALAHLRHLIGRGAFGAGLTVYECRHCDGGWHVGHRPRRRR